MFLLKHPICIKSNQDIYDGEYLNMMHKFTMLFIFASAKALPSTSMHQTTSLISKEMRIAYGALLFFSISRRFAAFCTTILKDAEAVFLDFFTYKSSFFSLCT